MITNEHIQSEVEISHKQGCTTKFLRCFILAVVDRAIKEHYGTEYSMKCLQSSAVIKILLEEIGIQSDIWCGATCYAKIDANGTPMGWSGFWGDNHHIWVATEFHEYVDLTISQMHKHPASTQVLGRMFTVGRKHSVNPYT